MFNKSLEAINLVDIEELVGKRKLRENEHLDYKVVVTTSDSAKKELLKDITGFANARGGFLIIGVAENDCGYPVGLPGLSMKVGQQKIDEWINDVIMSNVSEKIDYKLKLIEKADGKCIIVIYAPESSRKPHMVTYQTKNIYYVRHNTSTLPATQAEVKEMYINTMNKNDIFLNFLKQRGLDKDSDNFGQNTEADSLINEESSELKLPVPRIIFAIIPRFIESDRINTISDDFLKWLDRNSAMKTPFQGHRIYANMVEKEVKLDGILLSSKKRSKERKLIGRYNYFEFFNNGGIEIGQSSAFFWNDPGPQGNLVRPGLHLRKLSAYISSLLDFVRRYYEKIAYNDELLFQLSVINLKDFTLGGFGGKVNDKGLKWSEPYSFWSHSTPPPLCSENEFFLRERFIVPDLNDKKTESLAYRLSLNISRAFGLSEPRCYDFDHKLNTKDIFFDDIS